MHFVEWTLLFPYSPFTTASKYLAKIDGPNNTLSEMSSKVQHSSIRQEKRSVAIAKYHIKCCFAIAYSKSVRQPSAPRDWIPWACRGYCARITLRTVPARAISSLYQASTHENSRHSCTVSESWTSTISLSWRVATLRLDKLRLWKYGPQLFSF